MVGKKIQTNHMQVTCKNCNQTYQGNYCSHCGQPTTTHEINFKFLWHDIQHGLFHFDKGMLYTIPQLYRNPGNTIHSYIEGKRVKHIKPFTMVFLLATIFILEKHLLNLHIDIKINLNQYDIAEWIFNHLSISAIAIIPLLSLWSYLLFRKQGKNYIEHLVVNAFITSQSLAFYIVLMPVYKSSQYFKLDSLLNDVGVIFYLGVLVWSYITFFTNYKKRTIVFKSLLGALLSKIVLILVFILVAILLIKLHVIKM